MSDSRPDVAVLGGGMAGLAAAWRLSDPRNRDQVGDITVYQRGWRLGGKAASHRGEHGRIEEHGLHVWLGYYDNAFRLIRECYDELDRGSSDPASPIKTWREAFEPAPVIGLEDLHEGDWSTWTAVFPTNDLSPGEPLSEDAAATPPTAVDFLARSVALVRAFVASLGGVRPELLAGAVLAGGREAERLAGRFSEVVPLAGVAHFALGEANRILQPTVERRVGARRVWQLLDLVSAQIRGMLGDDLLTNGFRSIDHLEYRDWIRSHGASEETCRGAMVRGLYDLAFSHRRGDPARTEFPAGLGLLLATKTFFDYRGALFWKMTAGMGDVVIAPLYQALRRRGVRFELFHRVDDVLASTDGTAVERVRLGRQVRLRAGLEQYWPLRRYGGLWCFPAAPIVDQLEGYDALTGPDLESFWCSAPDVEEVEIVRGRDFDEVVFAIPVGMAGHVTADLASKSGRWSEMLDTLETVGTQSLQLWLREEEATLGWRHRGSTVTSYVEAFDTYSSMSHLLAQEDWPRGDRPRSIAYFCSSTPHERPDDHHDAGQQRRAAERARSDALRYLDEHLGHYLPGAVDDRGFRWELLCGAGNDVGPSRLDSQHIVANVDPSDRYVQAIPGTDHARLEPGGSGFGHLHLAGDWTDCGLNAGCIEAAVISGIQAANSLLGRPRWTWVTGAWR